MHETGLELSVQVLLDDLSSIREVVLLYPDKNNKMSAQFMLSRMSSRQKKLAETFGIGEILAKG